MGKASSSKKVSRVARTGGGRTTRRSTGSWGFPLIMGLVVVLGVVGVVFSKTTRNASAVQPLVTDHWHAAYGFDICGTFLPDLPQPPNLIGLHTHGDGVIHIEPVDPVLDTGKNATLGRFVSGYPGLSLSQTKMTIINQTFKNGEKPAGCDAPALVQVAVNGVKVTGSFSKVRVPKDGWITVAFLPKGAKIPAPPNWDAKVKKADGTSGAHPTGTSTTLPGETTTVPTSSPPTTSPPGTSTTLR
jgi:hypothetical protein